MANRKLEKVTDSFEDVESHDPMIEAFQQYFKWHTHFEVRGTNYAGTKARYWLSQIRNHASTRRIEILEKQKKRKVARIEREKSKQK